MNFFDPRHPQARARRIGALVLAIALLFLFGYLLGRGISEWSV